MINEQTLTDASICPSCGAGLTSSRCATCGIDLQGELGLRLWTVSTRAAELLTERRTILETLRARASSSVSSLVPARGAPPSPRSSTVVPAPDQGAPLFPTVAPAPLPEAAPRSVQDLLLGLGAMLLAIAGIVFVGVSWGTMGIGGRSAIMAGFTALVTAVAAFSHRRGLTGTAEAIGGVAVVLCLVDAYGLQAAGLFGPDVPGSLFWAFALGVVATLTGAGSRYLPLRALRISAASLAQVAGWVLAAEVARRVEDYAGPAAVLTALFASLILARILLTGVADARLVVSIGQPLAAVGALTLAIAGAYDNDGGTVLLAVAVLGVLALLAAVAAHRASQGAEVLAWSALSATAVGWAVVRPQDALDGAAAAAALTATVAALLLGLLAAVRVLPALGRRPPRSEAVVGPSAMGGLVAAACLLYVAAPVAASVMGPFTWLASPWQRGSAVVGRAASFSLVPGGYALPVPGMAVAILLAALAVAAVAGAALFRRTQVGVVVAVALAATAGHVSLVALGSSLWLVLFADVVLGVLLCAAAALAPAFLPRLREPAHSRAVRPVRLAAAASGLVLLTVAAVWSLVTSAATLLVLPAVIITLVAAAGALTREQLPPRRMWLVREQAGAGAIAAAVVLAATELLAAVKWFDMSLATGGALLAGACAVAMATSHLLPVETTRRRVASALPVTAAAVGLLAGVGLAHTDQARLTVALSSVAVGALAAAMAARAPARTAWTGLGAGLTVAASWAAALWSGAGVASGGLVAMVAGSAVLVAAPVVRRPHVPLPARSLPVVEAVAAATMAAAMLACTWDADVLWLGLLIAGVAAAAVAVRPDRHRAGWISGGLLVLSSWVRLVDSDVHTPEAYTAPGAVALLIFGWFRRRRQPATGSWVAYGAGLAGLLIPSLLRSLVDSDATRPLLLGAVALAVLLVGAARRLQAPLVLGASVLLLDALIQFGPDIISTVPKWMSLGAVGLLLLTLGATYEKRLAELRRGAAGISRMQ